MRLLGLDGGVVCRDCFFDGAELGLAVVEATSAEGVDGAVGEIFGQIDEEGDFTDAGMDKPERRLGAGVLESYDGIVAAGMLEVFEGFGKGADRRVGHYRYDGDLSCQIKTLLDYARGSDEVHGRNAHFKNWGFRSQFVLRYVQSILQHFQEGLFDFVARLCDVRHFVRFNELIIDFFVFSIVPSFECRSNFCTGEFSQC